MTLGIKSEVNYIERQVGLDLETKTMYVDTYPEDMLTSHVSAIVEQYDSVITSHLNRYAIEDLRLKVVPGQNRADMSLATSKYYEVQVINPGLAKLTITREHVAAFQQAEIDMLEARLQLLKMSRSFGVYSTSTFTSNFPAVAKEGIDQQQFLAWAMKDAPLELFCMLYTAASSYSNAYTLKDLMEDAVHLINKGLNQVDYWVYTGVKGDYKF